MKRKMVISHFDDTKLDDRTLSIILRLLLEGEKKKECGKEGEND